MRVKGKTGAAVCIILAAGSMVWTAPTWGNTLNLRQCVDLALKQNPDLIASQARIAQAAGALRQARGNRWPKLVASIIATRTNDALNAFGLKLAQRRATLNDFGAGEFIGPSALAVAPYNLNHPDPVNNYDTRLELKIPVYNGGMIRGYVSQALAYVQAARRGNEAARQQVIFHVLQAYDGIHAARAYVKVAKQAAAAAVAYVKTAGNLFRQGVVVRSDLLSAQVNLENTQVMLSQAQNGQAAAQDQLHVLLGMSLGKPLQIGASFMPRSMSGGLDLLERTAVSTNPGIQALRRQVDAAAGAVKVARAAYYPHFNVMARQDWNNRALRQTASSYTVAGVLSWQLLDFGVTHGAVDRAEAGRNVLLARLHQAEARLRFQTANAWRKAHAAEIRVVARALAVRHAKEAQRMVNLRYANGVTTIVDVLAAQAQLDKARADLVAARYQQAVQRAALLLAAGKLDGHQF